MLSDQASVYQLRLAKTLGLMLGVCVLVWELSTWIVHGDSLKLALWAITAAGIAFGIALLKD
jgi:hypothetical protein